MKKEDIERGLSGIPEEIISEHIRAREALTAKRRAERRRRSLWVSLVACVCIAAWAIPIALHIGNAGIGGPSGSETPHIDVTSKHTPPNNALAPYTAEEISWLFPKYNGEIVNYNPPYSIGYAPSFDYLSLVPVPEGNEISTYAKQVDVSVEHTDETFKEFADPIIERLTAAFSADLPSYEARHEKDEYSDYRWAGMDFSYRGSRKYGSAQINQDNYASTVYVTGNPSYAHEIIPSLGGVSITIDSTKSDEEILASLEGGRDMLFGIFGEEFTDAKILRWYHNNEEMKYGLISLDVYYYNESDEPFLSTHSLPRSSSINIQFQISYSYDEKAVFTHAIVYNKYRIDPKEFYSIDGTYEMLSLAEAEELLYSGYCFSSELCPNCVPESERIDFHGYDRVAIEYIEKNIAKKEVEGLPDAIPFYCFYKKTGETNNGRIEYAQVCVPAIPISGYEEYFSSHSPFHQAVGQ